MKQKEPTKFKLKQQLMLEKAASAKMLEHLRLIASLTERLMQGSFLAMKLCRECTQSIDLAVGLTEVQTDQVRKVLMRICDVVVEGAVEWRRTKDPEFMKAEFQEAQARGLDPDVVDKVLQDADGGELMVRCSRCSWHGGQTAAS